MAIVTATAWRPSRRAIVWLAAALAATAVAACAQPPAVRSTPPHAAIAALDSALRAARADLHAPAVSAAVVACGQVVWAKTTGVLDVSSMRPASNGSLFILNSAAKSVVATMIMQEVQHGHLSLSSKLSEFYPWLPNARRSTVRMLLNMTSGLPDYLGNRRIEWMIRHRPRHHWTVDQVLTGWARDWDPWSLSLDTGTSTRTPTASCSEGSWSGSPTARSSATFSG
jgi:D-alanyl-D-alanine carboxypeptidase